MRVTRRRLSHWRIDGLYGAKKKVARERRPERRRHRAGTAYGCLLSYLTRFTADPCIAPGRLPRTTRIILTIQTSNRSPETLPAAKFRRWPPRARRGLRGVGRGRRRRPRLRTSR